MRSHGVTAFPDPTVVNGQIEFSGSGIGRSPDYQSAEHGLPVAPERYERIMSRIPQSRTGRRADGTDSLVQPAAPNRHRSGGSVLPVAALAGLALVLAACSGGAHDAPSGGGSATSTPHHDNAGVDQHVHAPRVEHHGTSTLVVADHHGRTGDHDDHTGRSARPSRRLRRVYPRPRRLGFP